jgi:hypothetical protein
VLSRQEDGSATIQLSLRNVLFEPDPGNVPFKGGKMRVRVAPDGRLTKIEGQGGIFGAAGAALNATLAGAGGVSSDTAGSQFFFPQFPKTAVQPGDTWEDDDQMAMPFGGDKIAVHTKGRLNEYEDTHYGRAAVVEHTVDAPYDIEFTVAEMVKALGSRLAVPVPVGAEGGRFKISGTSEMHSESRVIPETGDLVHLNGRADMTMKMSSEGIPDVPSEPFELKMKMKMAFVRVDGR